MFAKIHQSYRKVLAICDAGLIGKVYEEGNKQLDVRESFYKGDKIEEKSLINLIKKEIMEDSTFNIVGEKSVKIAIKTGLISQNNVAYIKGIPFILTLL